MRKLGSKILRILGKIPVTLGFLFFLFSTILPFYRRAYFGFSMIPEYKPYYSTYYWSFRVLQESRNLFGGYGTPRFIDYWFYEPSFYDYVPGPLLSNVLVVIFAAQILTLLSAIASVFFSRRILELAPLVLCSLVIVLMTHTSIILSASNIALDPYQLGYWLTYPSILLFLLSLIVSRVFKKKNDQNHVTYKPTHTLTLTYTNNYKISL